MFIGKIYIQFKIKFIYFIAFIMIMVIDFFKAYYYYNILKINNKFTDKIFFRKLS